MSHARRNRPLRLVAVTIALTAVLLASPATPAAQAQPFGPPEAYSHVSVARLTVFDGAARLVVHVHLEYAGYLGLDVDVPAGDGAWTGPADVVVPGLGTACHLDAGPDLHYRCGRTRTEDEPQTLPAGDYQFSVRVRRTGPVDGLQGTTRLFQYVASDPDDGDRVGPYFPDTFPVYADTHGRSTAEVTYAQLFVDDTGRTSGLASVPLQVSAAAGEVVTSVDVMLPSVSWTLRAVSGAEGGLTCGLTADHRSVHCQPDDGGMWPVGRRVVRVTLAHTDSTADDSPRNQFSQVSLTIGAGAAEIVDDFQWRYQERY